MQLWTNEPIVAGVMLSPAVPPTPYGQVSYVELTFSNVPAIGSRATLDLDFIDRPHWPPLWQWGRLYRAELRSSLTFTPSVTLVTTFPRANDSSGQLRLTASADWPAGARVSAVVTTGASPTQPPPPSPSPSPRVRPLPICWPSGWTIDR